MEATKSDVARAQNILRLLNRSKLVRELAQKDQNVALTIDMAPDEVHALMQAKDWLEKHILVLEKSIPAEATVVRSAPQPTKTKTSRKKGK